ncbi:MAG: BamA/OMP85 family outer membrane protein [Gemmatimonadota bacterium]
MLIALAVSGCLGRTRGAELYPDVAEHQNEEIGEIRFVGQEPFSDDTLHTLIDSEATHCDLLGLPICIPFLGITRHVHRVNVEVVRRDVARLSAFYRREGFFGTRVVPRVEPEAGDDDQVVITFVVRRGDPIILDSFAIEGTEDIIPPDSLTAAVPLKEGSQFDLGEFDAAADLVLRELQSRGYAYAEVLRNYSVDTLSDRATASVVAVPHVQTRVDSIIVLGAEHLGRREAARQLALNRGDLVRRSALVQSQSNLYNLPIVQLASVTIAPDSLQRTPQDSTTTTILVSIAEAPVNHAEAAVGYGSVECMRAESEYTNRSFTGGARTLNLQTSVSKIGLGGATESGIGRSLCDAFSQDTFENRLDYRLNAEFTQPYFLSPRNHLSVNLYTERVSEPTIFQREARGGRLTLSHRLAPRSLVTASLETQRATTIGSPVLFCSAFQVCLPADLARMSQPRLRNTIGLNYLLDRTDHPLDAARGHVLRSATAWAAPWLGSTVTFVRWTGEAAMYRGIRAGWVFAGSVRLGNFFRTASLNPERARDDFLPPEERFYAGGATTVRGFSPNALGNGVYVTTDSLDAQGNFIDDARFVPVGGTSLGIVNAEVRFPSPVWSRLMRLAAFIDAGAIGTGNIWNLDAHDWRYTPGVGIRIGTPVGPVRVDVAFNPHDPLRSVLFFADSTGIKAIRDDFAPAPPNFFGRLRVHVAIGQAF